MKKLTILITAVLMINMGGCGESEEKKETPNASASGEPKKSPQPKTQMPDPDQ